MTFIAVKRGSTSWRAATELMTDEVAFTGEFVYQPDGFRPAMVWDDALQNIRQMTADEITALTTNGVPASVTRRQLYRGLMQMGWLGTTMPQIDAAITAMIGAMPEPPREVARVEFFTSRDFLRNNPLLVSALMSPPLSKTSAQVDEFFRLCASFAPEGE
jgi:hypothetical protein